MAAVGVLTWDLSIEISTLYVQAKCLHYYNERNTKMSTIHQ